MKLKKILRQPSLKYISTRDDYETLYFKYFDGKPMTVCEKVADPAVWAAEIYGINRNPDSSIIGVGVIRKDIFEDYGLNISAAQLKNLYIEIVKLLHKEGKTVHLFTNGTFADNDFLKEIADDLGGIHGIDIKLDIPVSATELIGTISKYQGIIAGRLHSCIIAYSLNIPAVGLVWNEKLVMFGKNIHEEDNFIKPIDFNAEIVVGQLFKSIHNGYDQDIRAKYRSSVKSSIEHLKNEYIINRIKK